MDVVVKARRRIKRFLSTGKKQARVHEVSPGYFEYKVKHHGQSLFFKLDKLGRLRSTKNS